MLLFRYVILFLCTFLIVSFSSLGLSKANTVSLDGEWNFFFNFGCIDEMKEGIITFYPNGEWKIRIYYDPPGQYYSYTGPDYTLNNNEITFTIDTINGVRDEGLWSTYTGTLSETVITGTWENYKQDTGCWRSVGKQYTTISQLNVPSTINDCTQQYTFTVDLKNNRNEEDNVEVVIVYVQMVNPETPLFYRRQELTLAAGETAQIPFGWSWAPAYQTDGEWVVEVQIKSTVTGHQEIQQELFNVFCKNNAIKTIHTAIMLLLDSR